ncbi:uncharacterized protein LOC143561892 [Bidens hawaiensis]|uniref:uncharacterized protein LOC143561892 n=1 Tax=Bidens hawaiensis TaxID=980011 RepID=UPI00404A79DB
MLSLNRSGQEQRHVRRNSSTLGEMLALSNCKNTSDLNKNKGHDVEADGIPENLMRLKPLPVSSTEFLKGKKDDDTKDLTMGKSQKSSLFKGNVSRLFFSRSQKSNKQKSQMSDDEFHESSRNNGMESALKSNIIIKLCIIGYIVQGSGNANDNVDQPSPISVLESQLKDDDHTSTCSSTAKLNKIGIDPNKYNLIDKSPPIGSISRIPALDHYAAGPVTPILGKTSTKLLSREEEEQECFLYVQTLLSAAGNNNAVHSDSVLARWHSPESPLDPSLRDRYMSLTDKEPVHQSKERHQRSFQRLVFDCVNEVLTSGTCEHMGKLTTDRVWGQMKEWISGEEMCDREEDGGGAVVERVVRKEVESEVWMEDLRLENEDVKHEIQVKLVEQLVDDFVVELIKGVILAYTP